MISKKQRLYYLELGAQAYARACDPDSLSESAPTLPDWRREECRYATGGKSLRDGLSNDELTRALANYKCWLADGRRATAAELDQAATRNRVEALRPLWESIAPGPRARTMADRFKIVFLEEAETFNPQEINQLRWTLLRLAEKYPAAGGEG